MGFGCGSVSICSEWWCHQESGGYYDGSFDTDESIASILVLVVRIEGFDQFCRDDLFSRNG